MRTREWLLAAAALVAIVCTVLNVLHARPVRAHQAEAVAIAELRGEVRALGVALVTIKGQAKAEDKAIWKRLHLRQAACFRVTADLSQRIQIVETVCGIRSKPGERQR